VLFEAMEKAGWYYTVEHRVAYRRVYFYRPEGSHWYKGEDPNDALAAVKAMKAAGYSI
jgi:hypothetical protein